MKQTTKATPAPPVRRDQVWVWVRPRPLGVSDVCWSTPEEAKRDARERAGVRLIWVDDDWGWQGFDAKMDLLFLVHPSTFWPGKGGAKATA